MRHMAAVIREHFNICVGKYRGVWGEKPLGYVGSAGFLPKHGGGVVPVDRVLRVLKTD